MLKGLENLNGFIRRNFEIEKGLLKYNLLIRGK